MLKTLQITTLVLFGGLVTEIALWASSHEGAWWLITLPPLLVYIGILSSLFAGSSKIWLLRSARTTFQALLGTSLRSTVSCIVLLPIVAASGFGLWSTWGMSTLTVQVYRGGTNPDQRLVGVGVYVEPITREAGSVRHKTNARGVAKFDVRANDYLNLSIRTEHLGRLQDGAVDTVEPPHSFLSVDVLDIPKDSWSEAERGATPPKRSVEIASAALTSLQPGLTSPRWSGNRAFAKSNAPWGLPSIPNSVYEPSAEYIVARQAFVLGFDPERRLPRWIANATRPHTGAYQRPRNTAGLDPLLPAELQARREDYRGSGYDRGNLISGRDVAYHGPQASVEAYYMSAVAPQTPMFNRSVWAALERYSRALADQHGVVYLLSGTVFSLQPDEEKVDYVVIGKRRVAVPAAFFRVIGRAGAENFPEFIAFLIPNNVSREADFTDFTVSVDRIEALTGLDFFQNLPDEVEAYLESRIPAEVWPIAEG